MSVTDCEKRLIQLYNSYEQLITQPNKKQELGNGIFDRYQYPVLTAARAPVFWRYDRNPQTNPYLMERFGINVEESLPTRRTTEDFANMGERIRKCLTVGYFAHATRMQADGSFQTVNGNVTLHAHPSSLMFVSVPVASSLLQIEETFADETSRIARPTGSFSKRS